MWTKQHIIIKKPKRLKSFPSNKMNFNCNLTSQIEKTTTLFAVFLEVLSIFTYYIHKQTVYTSFGVHFWSRRERKQNKTSSSKCFRRREKEAFFFFNITIVSLDHHLYWTESGFWDKIEESKIRKQTTDARRTIKSKSLTNKQNDMQLGTNNQRR